MALFGPYRDKIEADLTTFWVALVASQVGKTMARDDRGLGVVLDGDHIC